MPRYVLGFMNYCSHDPGAAIIKISDDGKVLDFINAEEGFLSRKKKSYQFPIRSIKYCLDYFEIRLKDIEAICVDYMDYKRINRTSNNFITRNSVRCNFTRG